MRICIFEECGVADLEPLMRSRPAFPLPGGRESLLKQQCRYFGAREVGMLVRPAVAAHFRQQNPEKRVNDLAWLRADTTVLVNWRWLPPAGILGDLVSNRVALVGEEVAYVLVGPQKLTYCSPNTLEDCLRTWRQVLPCRRAPGQLLLTVGQLARSEELAAA